MEFFIQVLIKGTSLLCLSLLILVLSRSASASFKHWLIGLTLISLLLLPLCVSVLPTWEVPITNTSIDLFSSVESNTQQISTMKIPELSTKNIPTAVVPPASKEIVTSTPVTPKNSFGLGFILTAIWVLISLLLMLKLVFDLLKMRRITSAALPFERGQKLLSKAIKVLISDQVKTPMTWGITQSYILFPSTAKEWSTPLLTTIIAHEKAHIQRKDFWIHTLAIISANVYWWHPLVWIFKKRLGIEREKACDERVLAEGINSSNYATSLIQVTRQLLPQAPLAALPLAKKSELKGRVQAILNFSRSSFSFSKVKQIQWAGLYAGIALVLAVITPIEKLNALQTLNTQLANTLEVELPPLPIQKDSPKQETKPEVPVKVQETMGITEEQPMEVITMPELTPIPALPIEVESEAEVVLKAPKISQEKQAYYRKVIRKNSEYDIWIYGTYRKLGGFPFFEVAGPEDMMIIRENRNGFIGKKQFLLIITKAPTDGLKMNFLHGDTKSYYSQGPYKKGEELYFFLKNEEWVIDNAEKLKWMSEHLQILRWVDFSKSDEDLFEKIETDDPMIQQQQKYIALHFFPLDRVEKKPNESELSTEDKRALLDNIPYKSQSEILRQLNGSLNKFGRIKPSKTTSGSTNIETGQRFGTVIPRVPKGQLIDLRFHVRYNNYEKIDFALSLYQIEGENLHRINKGTITFSADNKNPWIKVPLESHQIGAKGDIMAVLEIQNLVDEDGDGHLFFSQSDMLFRSLNRKYGKEYGFWDGNFAFYFTVRE